MTSNNQLFHKDCIHIYSPCQLCDNLINQLMLVDLDADTMVTLALHLKQEQLDAMTYGDNYIPILPKFAIYCTCISHGCELLHIMTEVLGVKTMLRDAKLLAKFFTQMTSVTNDQHDGIFLPTKEQPTS